MCWYSWSQFGVWNLVISYGLIYSLMLTRRVWWDVKTEQTRPIWMWLWVFQVFSGKRESLPIYVNIKQCEIGGITLECHSEIQKLRTKVWGSWMGLEQTKLCGYRLSGSLNPNPKQNRILALHLRSPSPWVAQIRKVLRHSCGCPPVILLACLFQWQYPRSWRLWGQLNPNITLMRYCRAPSLHGCLRFERC